jgi:hypothetical protein
MRALQKELDELRRDRERDSRRAREDEEELQILRERCERLEEERRAPASGVRLSLCVRVHLLTWQKVGSRDPRSATNGYGGTADRAIRVIPPERRADDC